ncbi:hypothetical protein H6P81_006839 [Aristolochia fimbriata]|uniref:RNase H type-1 domain-containing protein n=1 Tax=Aristolochia fimbriata TaxID=158543 RepID=A0AAV7EYE8_ARIFI|nr:hypothetical protein H6P81_006839 [Aristolochia fimbriata]
MNPLKCAFGVTSGKFLGFIVHHRGIQIDQSKIDAIQKMPEPRNVSELKSFQGHLAYIRRFISNLAGRCQPFSRLLKKGTPFEWDDACRNAFNNIKAYLTKPPVLIAPIVDKPLLLYIAAQEKSVGALLAQCDEDNKERSLYYLSRTLVGAEFNYTPIEKSCLALIFAVQKLRHFLLAHSTNLISRADPLKYIMSRPILSGRLAKWALLLSEFEINYVPQRAVKGQALANFLADHPVPAKWELTEEFPDEEIFLVEVLPPWEMYFDGAAQRNGAGAGVLFVSPKKDLLPYSFVLTQICSNNEAEYQAILLGLGIAVEMHMPQLNIYDDSALVIKQLTGEFEIGVNPSSTSFATARSQSTCESESKFAEQLPVRYAKHIKLAQSSICKSNNSAITGQLCSGTPLKWPEPANRANSMPTTYTNHRCRFTQRSLPGHSKLRVWISSVPSPPNLTPTGSTSWLPLTTSPNGLKPQPTKRSKPPPSPISFERNSYTDMEFRGIS